MLGGADNPNGELPSYITGADSAQNSGKGWIMDGDPARASGTA
ncbi:IS600 ORF2 [Shigella sonnei]|nr:IS600 ORF2 [Shigella sonnei]